MAGDRIALHFLSQLDFFGNIKIYSSEIRSFFARFVVVVKMAFSSVQSTDRSDSLSYMMTLYLPSEGKNITIFKEKFQSCYEFYEDYYNKCRAAGVIFEWMKIDMHFGCCGMTWNTYKRFSKLKIFASNLSI